MDRRGIIRQGQIIETGTLDELRHLTRTQILVRTKQPISSLSELKGIHDIEETNKGLAFQVDTEELDHAIRHISQFGIIKLESTPPTLEDLFMRHYESKDKAEGKVSGGVHEWI